MKELTLLLGTNLGNREANIAEALRRLDHAFCGRRLRFSGIIETEACGFAGPPFLNAAVVYSSARRPQTVLQICKRIERAMGRTDAPEFDAAGKRVYHDRIIDIDILTYGGLSIRTPELIIPHPQVQERLFVKDLLDRVGK